MSRSVVLIVVLSVLLVLAIAFAVLYFTGVIPASHNPTPVSTAASFSPAPLIAIWIVLMARKHRRKQEAQNQDQRNKV
jgi:hypothetical protein